MSPPGLPGKDKDAKAGIASRSVLSLFKLVVKLCKICYNNCIHNYKKRTNCLRLNPKNKKVLKKEENLWIRKTKRMNLGEKNFRENS